MLPERHLQAHAHLILVGKSSGVKKKTAPNMPDAPNIPIMADTTDSVASTELPAKNNPMSPMPTQR